jgi:hypothetical protein
VIYKGGREVLKQLDGEEVFDPDNTCSVLSTVPNAIRNYFEYKCMLAVIKLLNSYRLCLSTHNRIPANQCSYPVLSIFKYLVHQVRKIQYMVRRWVWNPDLPGGLVADEMSFGKMFTSVAAVLICKLLAVMIVMG